MHHLTKDGDPETVDYTLRGDVKQEDDGSDADVCEGDGLGEDLELTVVDEVGERFHATFGGPNCNAGSYILSFSLTDSEGQEIGPFDFDFDVMEDENSESPGRPHGLRASGDNGTVTLNWNAPDNDADVSMYRILRHRPEDGETEPLVYVQYTGSRATSYADTSVVPGTLYAYQVKAVDFFGFIGEASEPVSVRVPRTDNPATGTPTISGTARVGETLTADASGISDDDGITNASFTYQWISSDGTTDTDIAGATGATYTLISSDAGKTIKVRVYFTDDGGNAETLTSTPTAAVAASVPSVPRFVEAGQGGTGELDVSWESPNSNGGSSITGYKVQWKEATGSWNTSADVSEATTTNTTYTITSLSLGVEYSVRIIATNSAGDGPASAEATETADAQTSQQQGQNPNNPATGAPEIIGDPLVGRRLTASTSGIADADGITAAAFAYQWLRLDGSSETEVADATASAYTLVDADLNQTIKVWVSFTDDAGNQETLTSEATPTVEEPLTAELRNVPESHSGTGTFTLRILFSEPITAGFSALKEHSFEATNATIKRAQRVDGRNDLRKFTIQPSSDADVLLVLPVTTDCEDEGAICTSDNKVLSNRLEIVVPGPAPANSPATGTPTHNWDFGGGADPHGVHVGDQ